MMNGRPIACEKARDDGLPSRVAFKSVIGADVELGNFVLGNDSGECTCMEASRALLEEVDGVRAGLTTAADRPEDWGRKFLATNGGSVYIDSDHFEVCTPETSCPGDFVAAWHAMLRIAHNALSAANDKRTEKNSIVLLANNSDGVGHSYGSHLNFSIPRQLFTEMFDERVPALGILASYQVSSIIFTGQGKVGAENGHTGVAYQLSQRADYFECLVGYDTMKNRPICNTRDEPLRADSDSYSRLHCIFYDSTLCHVATYLKVGVMNVILALLSAGELPVTLALLEPVEALHRYSHDPTLKARSRLLDGPSVTALDLQLRFLEHALRCLHNGGLRDAVPEADAVVRLWVETLERLEKRDFDTLARQIDWVLKRRLIERAVQGQASSWNSPDAKYLDHLYASLNPATGLYWAAEREGMVELLVSDNEIASAVENPPLDTRAWPRAMLLRLFSENDIDAVDWDKVRIRLKDHPFASRVNIALDDPLATTCSRMRTAGGGIR